MSHNLPIVKHTHLSKKISTREDIQLFQVNVESETLQPLYSISRGLLSTNNYILVNKAVKKIFIWKGSETTVKSQFVGTYLAKELREDKGLTYRVKAMEEGNETQAFNTTFSLLIQSSSLETHFLTKKPDSEDASENKLKTADDGKLVLILVMNAFSKVKFRKKKSSILKGVYNDLKRLTKKMKRDLPRQAQFEIFVERAMKQLLREKLIINKGSFYVKSNDWDELLR